MVGNGVNERLVYKIRSIFISRFQSYGRCEISSSTCPCNCQSARIAPERSGVVRRPAR